MKRGVKVVRDWILSMIEFRRFDSSWIKIRNLAHSFLTLDDVVTGGNIIVE
jgi:hypothetical protein